MNGEFKAEVGKFLITYYNTGIEKHIEFECLCVAVDSLREESNKNIRDGASAVEICGYKGEWLPYEHKGDRKYFIMGKALDDGTYENLDNNLAKQIAATINKIAAVAAKAPSQYKK